MNLLCLCFLLTVLSSAGCVWAQATAQAPAPDPQLLTLEELMRMRQQPFAVTNQELQARGWRLASRKNDQHFGCISYWWAYPPRQPGEFADSMFLAVYPGDGNWNLISHRSASRREYALVRAAILARGLTRYDNPHVEQATDSAWQCYEAPRQYINLDYDANRVHREYYVMVQRRNPQPARTKLEVLGSEAFPPPPDFSRRLKPIKPQGKPRHKNKKL
ncbi:hypothetical protein MON38_11650 [Hymenobacter sp. DH14]|uniref:Lipoprotein n=1 Tax=Hymenobacter cyanobacteriorum TaxID=2926463 RepID=A0A9X2AFC5_9BACT|nr:hypothetical protein [Hymenobacter cyanobacteriorum]MCI1188076.1 hypothetical protein [Hymenobacter cyanobacteriorum]